MRDSPLTERLPPTVGLHRNLPPLLTVQEVADRLRCSRALIYQLCERGKLVHHRLGVGRGTIRVSEPDIETFLEESRVSAPPPQPRTPLKHIRLSPR